jgi:hypothetical protein
MTLTRRLHRRGWLVWFCGGALAQTSTGFGFTSLIAQFVILLFSAFWGNVVRDLVSRVFFGH